MITSYPSPSYDPYRNTSPYTDQNSTGVARDMQLEHERMLEMSKQHELDRMMNDVRYLINRVDELDHRLNAPVAIHSTYKHSEPSVEVIYTAPSWLSRWLDAFITDPFWEFLKRPSIK